MSDTEKRLSTEPYKGVRDFYPRDMFIQNYLFAKMRETAESFGYAEYAASILEPSELYQAKTSEEIVNEQTYAFTDRGDRKVTLRPEMTPTVARMIAGKRHELATPLRWYSISNVFRYERPQRGRLREHWQLNCDLLGVSGTEAEAEIIELAHRIVRNFGLNDTQFEIRLNSRALLAERLTPLLKNPELLSAAIRLLDRKDKMKPETFEAAWKELSDASFSLSTEPDASLAELLNLLEERGIKNARFDPFLARGFDYYTGVVFEVFDTHPDNNRALFGGGRYDNLLDLFGAERMPAVGFGMGDVTIRDTLETYHLLPAYAPAASLYLCRAQGATSRDLALLADRLRDQGVRVAVDITERKIGDQIKAADKQGIPFVTVIGGDELVSRLYKVKRLATGEETVLPETGVAVFIAEQTSRS